MSRKVDIPWVEGLIYQGKDVRCAIDRGSI